LSKLSSTTLGELIEFQRGYDLPKSEFIKGDIPVISSNGVLGYHNEYKVKAPGVTIGRSGTVGLPHYIKNDFFPHNTALFIKEFNKNYPKYIFYLIKNLGLNNQKTGSGVPTMNRNHLHPLKIKAHLDILEQQKIAKVLSILDAKIELNNRINKELETMAKTLYDYWFVQFDFPDVCGESYKSSGGTMVYNEELKREIPEGWEVKELKAILDIFDSVRIPLSSQERENRKGIYPYYGATSIMDYIDDYLFDGDYILLAEDGSVMDSEGFPIMQYIWGKTWVNNHAHILRSKNINNMEYVFQTLQRISVVKIMTGSIQKKINQENLLNVKIMMPNDILLQKFSKFASSIRKKLIVNTEQSQHLTQLRDFLLPMLMNGQVSVKS
jgi:type I restriction enzyme S subunit